MVATRWGKIMKIYEVYNARTNKHNIVWASDVYDAIRRSLSRGHITEADIENIDVVMNEYSKTLDNINVKAHADLKKRHEKV